MFESFDKPKAPIFRASIIGFLIGALVVGATLGIWVASSEDDEARPYWLFAAIVGALMGSIAGAIVGIIVGAITFARGKNS